MKVPILEAEMTGFIQKFGDLPSTKTGIELQSIYKDGLSPSSGSLI